MPEEKFEEVNLFDEDKSGEGDVTSTQTLEADEGTKDEFIMPEKFAGKTVEDVVKSYTNLESEYGRKNNEVGELRKLTDQILRQQVTPPATTQVVDDAASNEVGFDDLVENPNAAVNKVLDSNPRIAAIEADIATNAQSKAHDAILVRHEDADAVVGSAEFQSWVGENPSRQKMFADASNNLDHGTAAEMLDLYKSSVQSKTDAATETRDAKASEGLKNATTEKGGKKPAASRKIYKRTQLIDLKIHDPRKYESMSAEIQLAYAEGRVR